ncbi:MAG: class I SAM-dependent methyltransferase [Croceibacterium sp.]
MRDPFYEGGRYLATNPDWHAGDAPFKALWISDILVRNEIMPRDVVEVGCGSGEILVELAGRMPATRFEGYDISSDAMRIAAPKATDRVSFKQGDYFAAETAPADLLMAIDVFEHVDDYLGFIRAMKPRAEYKLFHIPLDLSAQGLMLGRSLMYTRKAVGHLHYFCKDTALATLRDCDLQILDWNYIHGAESLPNRKLRTRLMSLPRRLARLVNEDLAVRLLGGASMMVLTR